MEPNSRVEGPSIGNVADEGRDWHARVGENLQQLGGESVVSFKVGEHAFVASCC